MTSTLTTLPQQADQGADRVQELLIRSVTTVAAGVISLELVDPEARPLPAWSAGAHVELVLPSGLIRQYSLCGRTEDRSRYEIAVLRTDEGRGGSVELHDTDMRGRRLTVRGPRNHFPLVDARRHLLIAGGIGVTPMLPMVRDLAARGGEWRIVYGGRSRDSMAFIDELDQFEQSTLCPQDEFGLIDVDAVLDAQPPGTVVYCCGPTPLLDSVEASCRERCLELHLERFAGKEEPPERTAKNFAFELELRRSGVVCEVPQDLSILEVVRQYVPDVPSSCEEGFCGSCEVRVIDGTPDHRDLILSDTERACGETMMICVGRSQSRRLVLDL